MRELQTPRARRQKANVGAGGIIDVAERLFAGHGFDAVSLRQIAIEAGLSNPFSVQYHFGDRDGLVRAIYAARLPNIDHDRAAMIAALESSGAPITVAQLLDCLCRPFLHDHRGFSQFLGRVLRSPEQRAIRAEFDHLTPASDAIYRRIMLLLPHLPQDIINFRITAANLIVLDMLATPNLIAPESLAIADAEQLYTAGLAAGVGCIEGPLTAL